ncbi:MAG: hypothetical protein IPM32_02795 [Ignavibacteriae bacterium]|nr:hypothetical protein [Ignavibacteriota bacterium]
MKKTLKNNDNDLIKKLIEYTQLLIDIDIVKLKCKPDYFNFITKNITLKNRLNNAAHEFIENDETFVISETLLLEIVKFEKNEIKKEYELFKSIIDNNQSIDQNNFNIETRKIVWISKLEKLNSFFNILIDKDLIEKCSSKNFINHFQISNGSQLENKKNIKSNFIIWKSSQRLLVVLFEMLSIKNFIKENFFDQDNKGYVILTENFIDINKKKYSNARLSIASTQNKLHSEKINTLANDIISLLSNN